MRYYAKLSGPHPGGYKIFVEIWEAEPIGESTIDSKVASKSFWRYTSAKRWIEKEIMRRTMKNKLQHFFISDEYVIKDMLD